ncbi:uncharacterized protein LOC100835090 [Brachypodium distachyon]|uniref:Uncharacterized protein n=1 Tax=Brachypodium distachyon TaxID=15368 RepID=I1HG08_BRADI|nr:uncharacterized protein LOC100835090 [Brachypodium distachyon]KQK04689.1 hypothetical protein BRADI_2g15290v3 [Brachypodium distachyon]|eukprot:XP_003565848.1 uncharacterized protein LOC100835090 [Brachypodium distachyon]
MEAPLLLPISTGACSSSSSIAVFDDDDNIITTTSSSSSSPSAGSIAARYLAVLAIAAVSLFAQHEASKGFRIDVLSAGAGAAGRRFDLLFVSNGRAERLLLRASRAVEQQLFPDASFPRRRLARVTVRLMAAAVGDHNLSAADATVDAIAAARGGGDQFDYVISLNPGLFSGYGAGEEDVRAAVARALRRAVARMWLWDGRGAAPAHVTESMVEYLAAMADGAAIEVPCLPSSSSSPSPAEEEHVAATRRTHCVFSARLVKHLEEQRRGGGFVARLNRAMRDRWSDAAVDAALGAPARPICEAFLAAAGQRRPSVDSTVAAAA